MILWLLSMSASGQGITFNPNNGLKNGRFVVNTTSQVVGSVDTTNMQMNVYGFRLNKFNWSMNNSPSSSMGMWYSDDSGWVNRVKIADMRWSMTNVKDLIDSMNAMKVQIANRIPWPDTVNVGPIMTKAKADSAGGVILAAVATKMNIPSGLTGQYIDGTGSLQTSKTALSQFTNDVPFIAASALTPYYLASNPNGYISSYTETDPTVPSYSKSLTAFSVIKSSTDPLYKAI